MNRPALLRKTLAVSIAALVSAAASAQEGERQLGAVQVEAAVDREIYQAEVATSATRINAPLKDIPQTVNVVTEALMEDQGVHSLQDALRNVPGVSFHIGDGQRDQVYIRGFDAIGDQFVDGLRDDGLYYRDLANVERVEVVKGPAAVLYGRGSSGGIVNRITKKPGAEPVREAELVIGSFDQKRASFDLGDSLSPAARFRIVGAVEDSGSFRNQGFIQRDNVAPSLALRLAPDTSLLVQLEHLRDRRVTDMGIPAFNGRPADVSIRTYYGTNDARHDDYSEAEVTSGRIRLEHKFRPGLTLSNQFGAYGYRLDRQNTLVTAVNAAGTATLQHGDVRRNDDGWFNQLELTQNARTGSVGHQLLYGVEIGQQNKDFVSRNWTVRPTTSVFAPVNYSLAAFGVPGAPANDNLTTMKVQSFYLQDLVSFSRYWKALVGVRHDTFRQAVDDRLAGASDRERTDREWSPRGGLVFQPTDWQSYYVSYSRSFQPSGETLAFTSAQAQMEPERTTNLEAGVKLDLFGGRAAATASVFELERTNIKSVVPNTATILPVGEQRTRGSELTLAGEIAPGWQLSAGYAYLDTRIVKSVAVSNGVAIQGKRAALTPLHSANAWLMRDLGGGFKAGAGLNYAGDRYAAPDNLVNLGSYLTADAVLRYEAKAYDLALNLKNLGDERYFISGHGASNHLNMPGAPRSIELTARVRF
ncbi:MAG TPA: TonB-dependent siderophore receptor [Rhodocyclaceae bacterium]|nr:TonB-dependent siderophore receptor [Rhodocyclaceae bacterium]